MTERVPKIEQSAITLLGFISHHDIGFHLTRCSNGFLARNLIACSNQRAVHLEPFEKISISKQPVFYNLAISGDKIALRQAVENADICQNQAGLMKCPD